MVDLSAYELVNKEVHDLLLKGLNEKGWDFILERRVKSRESIERKNKSKPQRVITDYSGVRVILKRISDVRRCIEFIASKYEVDHSNSTFNPLSFVLENEFGYQSSHVVVRHNNLYTEIQVRTLVQHAWALTSHSLRYKESTQDSIFDRKLNRLSGLLCNTPQLLDQ